MVDTDKELESLHLQLSEARENRLLVQERKAKYVMDIDIPLDLIKEERRLEREIASLEQQISDLAVQAGAGDQVMSSRGVQVTKDEQQITTRWSWPFLIAGLNFLVGVLGNLVAAWVQQDFLGNVFTISRIVTILFFTMVALVVGVLVQQPSLSRKQGSVIILVLVVLTALVVIVFPIFSLDKQGFDYAVQVQAKDTSEDIANADVRIDLGGGIAPLRGITDTDGFVRIHIDALYVGQRAILIIEATGYKKYRQEVDLTTSDLTPVIQLESIQ